jgi:hypothetical protein
VDPKLAIHNRIRVGADPRGADRVSKARRGGPRKINQVLTAGGLRAGNNLRLAQGIERGLTAELSRRFRRSYDRIQIVIVLR